VIGREKEIERVIQILCRRTKNNPVLMGEAGVGKTAIVEGLAQRDRRRQRARDCCSTPHRGARPGDDGRRHQVPRPVRGAHQGGDERRSPRQERRSSSSTSCTPLVGAGAAEGRDRRLQRAQAGLSRGEIQCIGATTLDEYRKYIEKDSALDRRFQW
jgi:ATP-dependent Clp protease ATP-binding subunit ClpC